MRDVIDCWDQKAKEWSLHIGLRGDNNRFFNSDPVLWNFLGNVSGKIILDAGCGTGYLSVQLANKGASLIGIDISEKMIEEATRLCRQSNLTIDFKVDSCSTLSSVLNNSIDIVVSNYVLMDTPDLRLAVESFYRVLRPNGKAVLVFSHPCFDELTADEMYFDEFKKTENWGQFKSNFVYFHRPLSQYWKTFKQVGFQIVDFDEPVAQDPNIEGFKEEWKSSYRKRPYSVAFCLMK